MNSKTTQRIRKLNKLTRLLNNNYNTFLICLFIIYITIDLLIFLMFDINYSSIETLIIRFFAGILFLTTSVVLFNFKKITPKKRFLEEIYMIQFNKKNKDIIEITDKTLYKTRKAGIIEISIPNLIIRTMTFVEFKINDEFKEMEKTGNDQTKQISLGAYIGFIIPNIEDFKAKTIQFFIESGLSKIELEPLIQKLFTERYQKNKTEILRYLINLENNFSIKEVRKELERLLEFSKVMECFSNTLRLEFYIIHELSVEKSNKGH